VGGGGWRRCRFGSKSLPRRPIVDVASCPYTRATSSGCILFPSRSYLFFINTGVHATKVLELCALIFYFLFWWVENRVAGFFIRCVSTLVEINCFVFCGGWVYKNFCPWENTFGDTLGRLLRTTVSTTTLMCDRCKREVERLRTVYIPYVDYGRGYKPVVDLCDVCWVELEGFLGVELRDVGVDSMFGRFC
jgi:hypothetical protein